jgi:hypothetical protein
MSNIQTKGRPSCPNHGEPLEDIPFPMPKKGVGICPVSKCPFDYEVEVDEDKVEEGVDKFGNKTKIAPWKVTGDEN